MAMNVVLVLIQKDVHIFSFLVLLYCTFMYRFISARTRSKLCRIVFLYVVVLAGQRHFNTGLSFFSTRSAVSTRQYTQTQSSAFSGF